VEQLQNHDETGEDLATQPPSDRSLLTPRIIKAEANLLRLPLFALDTKGLRTLDAIECRGNLTRDDVVHEFVFRASRNATTPYPGPLARSAHLAFLSLMAEQGFPLQNPITWAWRDLCRRMKISCSGRTVQRLKAAIASTASLSIMSVYALYSKPAGKRICTREDVLHLYDRVSFLGTELPEGGASDTNQVWLSEWYLANLNAFFTAPLDYELWLYLDQRSPIASRLYEFLLLNFYSGVPVLRINYTKLAQFLPIRSEAHRSQARHQLDPALTLLAAMGVIETTTWSMSKDGLVQLQFHRGSRLVPPRDKEAEQIPLAFMEDRLTDVVEVEELRTLRPPEWLIVTDFYRLWLKQENHRPTKKELVQARELIALHGQTKLKALIQLVVKRMRKKWPDAKTFGSVTRYLDEVVDEYERDQRRIEQERQEQLRRKREREEGDRQRIEQERFEATWRPVWEGLPEHERENLRRGILDKNPFLTRVPRMVESLCLEELARRREPQRAPDSVERPRDVDGKKGMS
jgi:hypothetical protein